MHYWVQWLSMTNRTSYKSYSMVQSGKNEPDTEETVKQSKVKQNFRNKPIWWHWPVRLTPITVAATLYFLIVFLLEDITNPNTDDANKDWKSRIFLEPVSEL